jgi:hypothetical protein
MSKYHFSFVDKDGKIIIEYDTDLEPPRSGDVMKFDELTNHQNDNIYKVRQVWYTPLSAERARMLFEVEMIG